MASRLRIIYFGTPSYAVPTLEALARDGRFEIGLVVTQPDRPAGRGQRVAESPVKRSAMLAGLPVYQPASLRTTEARTPLEAVKADLFVVAAYGLIFGKATLAIPPLGCLNLHASLLPKYRGASPISAAILNGDAQTGISLMLMDAGLDTGPVIDTVSISIDASDTTGSLTDRLAALAAGMAPDVIHGYVVGAQAPAPQPFSGASITRPLTKADGWLDWNQPAGRLERQVRAMVPWPKAWTTFEDRSVQVLASRAVDRMSESTPGEVRSSKSNLVIACGEGALALELVQPAGGKPMTGSAFVAGRRISAGDAFGTSGAPEAPPPLIQSIDGE